MKVVVRSSSLLFFFANLLLGLPIRRRALGNSGVGLDGRGRVEESFPPGGSGEHYRRILPPQQEKSAAEPVAE